MEYKHLIDDIFATRSIYKSLVVCEDDLAQVLVKRLDDDDYPISTLRDVGEYLKNEKRILTINKEDYCNLTSILDQETISKISLVIFVEGGIDSIEQSKYLPRTCEVVNLSVAD